MSKGQARGRLDNGAWYHGSPEQLEVLLAGSTITRSRVVAEAFAHKPTCVGISDHEHGDDAFLEVCHNGTRPGYLYLIAEEVDEADVRPHPHSSFPGGGLEWLTNRPLRLRPVAPVLRATPPDCTACPRRPRP
jgi:hypothetical protein